MAGADPAEIEAVNRMMMTTWAAFARNGNPDSPLLPHWPRFNSRDRFTMMLEASSHVERDPGGKARASLDRLPFYEYSMPINFDEP
jgi:para-nitrobenzyl esterase